jgi:hypothetical protein
MAKHRWPRKMVIEELFVNDNSLHNHVHVASKDRKRLIKLAHVAAERFGGGEFVREFPPFDPVDCVHTSGSWHYRDSSNPSTARDCAHKGNGLAFDFGAPRRDEFAREVKKRYGAKESDF